MPQPTSLKPVDPDGWKVDPPQQPPPKPTTLRRHRPRSDKETGPSIDSRRQESDHRIDDSLQVLSPAAEEEMDVSDQILLSALSDAEDGYDRTTLPGRTPSVWVTSTTSSYPPTFHSTKTSSTKHAFPTPPQSRDGNDSLAPRDMDSEATSLDSRTPSFSSATGGTGMIQLTLNGAPFEVAEGTPITLSLLNLTPHYFLYVNGTYTQLTLDGIPLTPIEAHPSMSLKTIAYPSIFPLDIIYYLTLKYFPTRKQVSTALQTTWGIVIYNCCIAIITAGLARPLIKRAGSTSEIVVSVISGARILDTLLRDTLHKLLIQGTLTRRMTLLVLFIAQLSFMIAGSISLKCMSLLEFRGIPILAVMLECVCPMLHAGWVLLGVLVKAGTVSRAVAVVVGVGVPVAVVIAVGILEVTLRAKMGVVDPFTCGDG
ncbi:hypothetical protein BC829DRAFT_403310 [Chytridium lagenaria]|nr:hypothetical protein BC829DRAFT_403310 [Chytridium lagenaria]